MHNGTAHNGSNNGTKNHEQINGARAAAGETVAEDGVRLDQCYGRIGISAVAAAARYQGAAKNPAYAPAPAAWQSGLQNGMDEGAA
jgi:hypothetical protein